MKVLAVDIGGTNTELAIVDSADGIVKLCAFKTKSSNSFAHYIDDLSKQIETLIIDYTIDSIGIGAPNFDSKAQTFRPVNFPWDDLKPFNLKAHLEDLFSIPTFLINDANASAMAENRYGAGKRFKDFFLITLGTGLGGGIIINNKLFEGAFGYAGEFGHTKIEGLDRQCNCGGIGCLETVVSANGIKKSYAVNMKEIRSSEPTQIPSVKAIFDMARNGDKRCQEILNFTFEKLGQKMADFIHVLNPEAIIFCGNIAKSLQSYLPVISEFCEEQLLDDFKGKVYYGISELLDNKMNVLGPASLALTKSEEHVC
ncbi:MAG: glucokinase [Flavobacteriales bacterium]|nr:glucokinase [Flavobacteriales bacterium]|tara:strand:- start:1668 stop:2606 length:939 start_codon:yes stop_codon:yes gene_type:complete